MKRLLRALAFVCLLVPFTARAQNTLSVTVSSDANTSIVTTIAAGEVRVKQGSGSPAAFIVTDSAASPSRITVEAGGTYSFFGTGSAGYSSGATVGTLRLVRGGPVAFQVTQLPLVAPLTGGSIPEASPMILTASGRYLAAANSFYFESLLNGCDPAAAIAKWNSIFNAAGTYTDAITGCLDLPAGAGVATNTQNNAIEGIAVNHNSSQQGQFPSGSGPAQVVAVNGMSWCRANNQNCEGLVAEVMSDAGLSGTILVGSEVGTFAGSSADTVYGYLVSPFGNTQVAFDNFPAFDVHPGGVGTGRATSGFRCESSSILVQNSFYANCFELSPIGAAGTNSQSIAFTSNNGKVGQLYQAGDNAGTPNARLIYLPQSGVAASFTTGAFIMAGQTSQVTGCSVSSLAGGAAGKFVSGTTGTCTVTITLPVTTYTGWSCTAQDLTTPADKINQTAFTTTTATMSGTTVSGDIITYNCVGF